MTHIWEHDRADWHPLKKDYVSGYQSVLSLSELCVIYILVTWTTQKSVKSLFISVTSNCSITNHSVLLTSSFASVKELNICNKTYDNSGINYFWSVNNFLDVWDKLRACYCTFDSLVCFNFLHLTSIQSY